MDGVNEYSGRVEVCVGGAWGTVCSSGVTSKDAELICKKSRPASDSEGEGQIPPCNIICPFI